MIEEFAVRRIEYDVYSIGLVSVRKRFAGKNDGVTRISYFRPFFPATLRLVSELRVYERAGVLQEHVGLGDIGTGILCP